MTDLIDPDTMETATEKRKEELIATYLKTKFQTDETKKEITPYPEEMIPNKESLNHLILRADLRKTTGFDYIPYEIMKFKEFRNIILRDTKTLI